MDKNGKALYVPVDQGLFYNDKDRLKTVLVYEFLGSAVVAYAFTLSQ